MDEVKQPEQTDSPQANAESSKKLLWIVGGAAIGAFVVLVIMFSIYQLTHVRSEIGGTWAHKPPSPTPTQNQVIRSNTVVFMRDNELWSKTDNGSETLITRTNGSVSQFKFSPQSNRFAYTMGTKTTNENGFTTIEPFEILLDELETDRNPISIHAMQPGSFNQYDYINKIRDFNFSDDGKKIAITSSESLWVYDIETGTKKNIFTLPPNTTGGGGGGGMVYAYSNPIFSPDMSKILLTLGYYEGSSNAIVDLATGELTKLPFTAYISGARAFAWLDNASILVSEYGMFDDPNATSTLYKVSADQPESKEAIFTTAGSIHHGAVRDQSIYFASQTQKPTGETVGTNIPTYDQFVTVMKLESGEQNPQELFTVQTANSNFGNKAVIGIMPFGDSVLTDVSTSVGQTSVREIFLGSSLFITNAALY